MTTPPPPKRSLAAALAELQRLCDEENYTLDAPERHDRSKPCAPNATRRIRLHDRLA